MTEKEDPGIDWIREVRHKISGKKPKKTIETPIFEFAT